MLCFWSNKSDVNFVKKCFSLLNRFLAHGDSYYTMSIHFRVGVSTVSSVVADTCDLIWKKMQPTEMSVLTTEDWHKVEEGFRARWNFPNCIGAVDSKHVVIQCPPKSRSVYYNYKGQYLMVLMAIVNHQYKFKYVDFGEYGSHCDLNVFQNSSFGKAFEAGKLQIPGPKKLPGDNGPPVPHCLIGDEAFPQRKDFMRPYPRPRGNLVFTVPKDQMIFNMRLSSAHNVVEDAFGILSQRWRIYQRRINLRVENVERVVKATLILHNWLCIDRPVDKIILKLKACKVPLANNEVSMRDLPHMHGYHTARESAEVCDHFKRYFNGIGSMQWQGKQLQKKYGM